MKKILLLSLGVLFFAGLVSCKKDHTCACTTTTAGAGTIESEIQIKDQTKKKAKDACDAMSTTTTMAGVSITTSCKLK